MFTPAPTTRPSWSPCARGQHLYPWPQWRTRLGLLAAERCTRCSASRAQLTTSGEVHP